MKQRPILSARDRSDLSVLNILRGLFQDLTSNIDGVLEDTDIEFLHDLRVAGRRTRTAMSQLKGVLPKPPVDAFAQEFKWLGVVTGPCRDLDVTLLEISILGARPESEYRNFDPLNSFLDDARRVEHSKVSAALRSARFRQLIDGWARFLKFDVDPDIEPPLATLPIIQVAGPRILKAHRRMVNRGTKLPETLPADHLHRLRIDAKKLRYLLEFFSTVFPQDATAHLIKELKKIQNILGQFNDTVVQQRLLTEFDGQPMSAIGVQSEVDGAIEFFARSLAQRQEELRGVFSIHFESFIAVDIQEAGFIN